MEERSASAAPAKSLLPPSYSGDHVSPSNPQTPNLSSPILSPSASSMDLSQISAPQLGHSHIQMSPSGALVSPQKIPAMSISEIQQRMHGGAIGQHMYGGAIGQQRHGGAIGQCMAGPGMIGHAGQLSLQSYGGAIGQRMYGGQLSFGGLQQLGSGMARPGMMAHAGQLSMLSEQAAAHAHKQKLVSQSIPSGYSISTISPQLSGLPHNGQSTIVQGNISQQQLLKQMQAGMSQLVQQQSHILQQQQKQQQLLKQMQASMPSQLVQQQSHIQQQQQLLNQIQARMPSQLIHQQSHIQQQQQSTVVQDNISQQQLLKNMQAGILSNLVQQQQQRQHHHAILPQQLSLLQPSHITLGLQQQVSQLVQQQAQLGTVQEQHAAQLLQQQHLHQLLQLQQKHNEQQSPHVPGCTISKSLKGSQPGIPASGTNMTREIIRQGISDVLLGKSTIQDLVSQVHGHLQKKRLKQAYGHLHKNRLKLAHGHLHKKHLKRAKLHLHNKRLKQVRELESQQKVSDAAKKLEAIQLMDSMVKSEQLSLPVASSHVLQKIPQL